MQLQVLQEFEIVLHLNWQGWLFAKKGVPRTDIFAILLSYGNPTITLVHIPITQWTAFQLQINKNLYLYASLSMKEANANDFDFNSK